MSETVTPTKKRRKKFWSFSAGEYHFRVRCYETPNGTIYAERKDPSNGCGYRAMSLRHPNGIPYTRDEAILWARQQSAEWMASGKLESITTPTLSRIFALYQQFVTPGKAANHQKADQVRSAMWTRVFGAAKDLSKITLREWQDFIRDRRCGAIDCRGQPVPADQRTPVSDGSIWSDLVFLNSVLNWATKWRNETGQYLLTSNPCRGYPVPKEQNPKRPVVNSDRFEKIRGVADQVMMAVGSGKSQRSQPSYLPELLDLVWGTGRRISAVLALRFEDLRLDLKPHGAIRWPKNTDKIKREWVAPLNAAARAAIDRILAERPGIGAAPLFPSPLDPSKPMSKELADKWLLAAEKLARVEKQEGSLWHAYRRGWATERKGLPLPDLKYLGGWKDSKCLEEIYQQPDWSTMVAAAEPRRVKQA